MAKWRDLKAQGVKRCGIYFTSGKQCRRRAATGSWVCENHQWVDRSIKEISQAGREADLATHREGDDD